MTNFRRYLRWGLALGLGLALTMQTAKAGTLEILLSISSTNGPGPVNVAIVGDGFNNAGNTDNSLSADTTNLLNPFLASLGYGDVSFGSLGATSNIAGSPISSFITQSGTVTVAAGSTLGDITISILAYGAGFTVPPSAAGNGLLSSSTQAGFTNTALGDQQSFQSGYNSNSDPTWPPSASTALQVLAPTTSLVGLPPKSLSNDATPVGVGPVDSVYTLLNQSIVTIQAGGNIPATVTFGGQTVLTAAAVPEPASVIMTMSALPLIFGLIRRSRRGLKIVG